MSQHEFDKLLEKYLAGACDPEEEKIILDWYERVGQVPVPVEAGEKEAIRQRIWQRLYTKTVGTSAVRPLLTRARLAMAACVLLVLAGAVWVLSEYRRSAAPVGQSAPAQGSIEIRNIAGKPQPVRLEDGSVAVLQPNSVLSYPEHFSRKNRRVFLKGEAFFQVTKDPTKPFIVQAGDLTTEVLGTSFTVKSYEGAKTIEVAVATGRVSVYENTEASIPDRKEVILKPNQRITYDKQSKQLIPTLIERPEKLAAPGPTRSFVFENMALPDVLKRLEAAYGIDIFLENDALSGCMFNGDLNELPLFTQLELICKSLNAKYETRGTSIFINGKGCP
ncbi:FecR family protein [Larkinella soli]|uniref:FecR family protein n=1 Tax=Larkinella soli TaxID=1770527 RepID=UPI000FFBDA23|nr:FecR family protein [Larkinella soli]